MSTNVRAGLVPALVLAVAGLASACGGGGGGGGSSPTPLPVEQWTWVDVAGTACSDGSPTGLAVRPATDHDTMVLLFLDGGGACWGSGAFACPGLATSGPYGAAQFQQQQAQDTAGTIFDRTVPGTPFGGATLVFVPYCTGDVHWGSSTEGAYHHAGARNLALDVAWLAQRLAAPQKLVVAGSSAGGFGALLAHDLARTAWPDARGYLIDDSGPPLAGSAIPGDELAAWYASWNLPATLGPLCGAGCATDLSQAVGALQARYPGDRLALVSHLQDATIGFFVGKSGSQLQTALVDLVDQRFSSATPSPAGAHAFLVSGTGHVLLDAMATPAAGTSLAEWLGQMIDGDEGWTTLGHP